MSILYRIAERALNRPLLVHPDKVPVILGVLEGRIPLGDVSLWRREAESRIDSMPREARQIMRGPGASRFVFDDDEDRQEIGAGRPYVMGPGGVAVITITGTLVNRGAWVGASSGLTSYEGIKHQLATAIGDAKVGSILLDIESPGGEAVGAFEAAEAVRQADQAKPMVAVVNGMAASAAYALASGTRRIVAPPTSIAGSIGVLLIHADYSRWLDKQGITPTLIFAGARKVDGNPYQPLPEGVRDDLQREVNLYYDLFVETVSAGRRNLSPAAIRATEAGAFIGQEAVAAGLADDVGTFETTLADLKQFAPARAPARRKATRTGRINQALLHRLSADRRLQ